MEVLWWLALALAASVVEVHRFWDVWKAYAFRAYYASQKKRRPSR
jgi:hypothetical protein